MHIIVAPPPRRPRPTLSTALSRLGTTGSQRRPSARAPAARAASPASTRESRKRRVLGGIALQGACTQGGAIRALLAARTFACNAMPTLSADLQVAPIPLPRPGPSLAVTPAPVAWATSPKSWVTPPPAASRPPSSPSCPCEQQARALAAGNLRRAAAFASPQALWVQALHPQPRRTRRRPCTGAGRTRRKAGGHVQEGRA